MKTKVIVKIPAKEETEQERTVTTCDLCEGTSSLMYVCKLCSRDVCIDDMQYDPEEIGDCPDSYCEICYSLKYSKYMEETKKVRLELLAAKIKTESLSINFKQT